MKNLYSCLFTIILFTSCSLDGTGKYGTVNTNKLGDGVLPSNPANPYDDTGQAYDGLFGAYYDGSALPKNVPDIIARVQSIAASNSAFTALNGSGYVPLNANKVGYLAGLGTPGISEVISQSSMTSAAKSSLGSFMAAMVQLYATEEDAVKLYDAVITYEESVIGSPLYSAGDKKIMLVTTSIVRYAAYRTKKKPKKNTDPDWIIFVGHVIAGAEGAEENSAKAIVQALAVGIASNK